MSDPESLQYQCPTCKNGSLESKNLVVFIDGTRNEPGPKETNVVKLAKILKCKVHGLESERSESEGFGPKPLGCYFKGLGTSGDFVTKKLEEGIAWNVKKNVMGAYKWLVENYSNGDRIYLFGFSRGAYQVRALAGIIHEVGLVDKNKYQGDSTKVQNPIDYVYELYRSIDRGDPRTRERPKVFKQDYCSYGTRIHFVGVWDTVSSLGVAKTEVHITESASVTNACHFRHALALDERRVKFLPEYFKELNIHRGDVRSPRLYVDDVKELWFAGYHSDIGGASRRVEFHAGNVPLLWMRGEASDNGLVFKPDSFSEPDVHRLSWVPKDIDCGRKEKMGFLWKALENFLVYHQVSFSGTGRHGWRRHKSHPRLVIPEHKIHSSILSGDVYKPCATLGNDHAIPPVPSANLYMLGTPDEEERLFLLSLFSDQRKTLSSLGKIIFLLDCWLKNSRAQEIPVPSWANAIPTGSDLEKFSLTVISDVLTGFSATDPDYAKSSLVSILTSTDQECFPKALEIVRFCSRHERLRQRFITHDDVIDALVCALKKTIRDSDEESHHLIVDSLCHLNKDDNVRNNVVRRLGGDLSSMLEVMVPRRLVASLKLITSCSTTPHSSIHLQELASKITKLAEREKSPVGPAALEALVALKASFALNSSFTNNVPISNVLGYLDNTLPRLDVEVGGTSPSHLELPTILGVSGTTGIDTSLMRKIVSAVESRKAHKRISATLTVLKLCRNPEIRVFCSEELVIVHIFVRQLERKKTSLLAAYALKSCLELSMTVIQDSSRAAQFIRAMLDKGWFDHAVGRVDGFQVFRGLMASNSLREMIMSHDIVADLMKKLEGGDQHEVRTSLICLEIVGSWHPADLVPYVTDSIDSLTAKDKRTWTKGVKRLSALARTRSGERVIEPRVVEIVNKLLSVEGDKLVLSSQMRGPATALYDLCKNETLREKIQATEEFTALKRLHGTHALAARA